MYCRKCHYDLYGQVERRCPECGCRFDPADAGTYLPQLPTGLQTVFRIEGVRTFIKLVAIAALYGVLVVLLVPGIFSSRCGPLSGQEISRCLLDSIVQAHLLNAHSSSEDGTLTIDAIRHDLAPSWYSRSVAPRYDWANQWNRRAADIVGWCVLGIGPALGTIVFTRRWLRKLAIVMGLVCALLALFLLTSSYIVGGFMRMSSYAFVNDYVFVPGIDWRRWPESSWDKIVAFEKNPWPGSRRVVAKTADTIRIVKEHEFQQLLSQQPLAKRAWDACIESGECKKVSE